jgi:hypothetical protein
VCLELNAFLPEELVSPGDQQFDVSGADELGIVHVISQPLANAIRIDVKGWIRAHCLLRSAGRGEANN